MTEIVKEWLSKAQGDLGVARRELAAEPNPCFDAVCFHAQQCVEKLMKSVLIHHQVLAPRTHDLLALNQLLRSVDGNWRCDEAALDKLNRAAVAYRYPGDSANRDDAVAALATCELLNTALMRLLQADS